MGNKCSCLSSSQSTDEAEDALLGQEHRLEGPLSHDGERRHRHNRTRRLLATRQAPQGPPPPYQQINPFYMLTEEQRLNLVARIALIQSLPVGTYECTNEEKKKVPLSSQDDDLDLTLEEDEKEFLCSEKSDKSDNIRECPICMNEFQQGDHIRLLPCMHYYHTRCIDEWLMRSTTCPNCMQRVDITFQRTSSGTVTPRRSEHRRTSSRAGSGGVVISVPPVSLPNSNLPVPTQNPPQVYAPFTPLAPPTISPNHQTSSSLSASSDV